MEHEMALTSAEIDYLQAQRLGRLATLQPDGSPQIKPVGFRYNLRMSASQKFRNVSRDGRAALVVDDIASTQPWRVRFLEIRANAQAVDTAGSPAGLDDASLIRIRPTRILSFGIEEPPGEPHLTRLRTRNLG
jgi:pyridoxamine 5'-phosphate oxidase family protein